MDFDPDSYIAAKSSGGGETFDPDAYLSSRGAGEEKPGYGTSLLRGGAQGLSLGFADEIAGGIGALKEGSISDIVANYIKNRDEYRQNDEAARAANPKTFGAGQIGGGLATAFVPGLNIGKVATLGGRALAASGLGAATALGSSNADLTQGDVGGALRDTAIGGLTGAALQPAIEKVVAPAVGYAAGKMGLGQKAAAPLENAAVKTASEPMEGLVPQREWTPQPAPSVEDYGFLQPAMETGVEAEAPGLMSRAAGAVGNSFKKALGSKFSTAAIGSALGSATGIPGGELFGAALGSSAKGAIEKVGGQVAKKALDAKALVERLSQSPQAQKYIRAIEDAATRGQGSLAATHFILSQTEPAYQQAVLGD